MRSTAFLIPLVLAACAQPEDDDGLTTVDLEGTERPAYDPVPAGSQPSAPAASPPAPQPIAAIPPPFQGRWGLVPADCEPGRADAKGLMEVTGEGLRFYESRGRPAELTQIDAASLRGRFAFAGEGMEWERTVTLRLVDGGEALLRSEEGTDALPQPLRYSRCRG